MRIGINYLLGSWTVMLALVLAGCYGSRNSSSKQNPVSGLKKRVLVSNQQSGAVNLIDGDHDTFSTSQTFSATGPGKLLTAGGITLAQESTTNGVALFDDATEQVTFRPATSNIPFDIAISNDGKTAWAAVRNPGFVQAIDTVSGNILASIPVPNAVRLVLSPQSTKLLVFADDPQSLSPANPVFLINTANVTSSTPVTTITGAGLDQPFTAVFNGENQAFILSCGAECGGTAASVTPLDLSGAAPVLGAPVSVSGATAGLLNAGTLFVAGTPPAANLPAGFCPAIPGACGTLQAIDANSLSAGAPVAITDGLHQKMAFTSNNRLYVGAANCTTQPSGTNQVRGCLSIFDTGASTVTFPTESVFRQDFDVTGLQPISGRNVIYVVQGGELDFFDITTSAVSTTITPLDVVGKAIDVVQIDP